MLAAGLFVSPIVRKYKEEIVTINRVYALCGSSNAGKTSTLNCLISLLRPVVKEVFFEHIGDTDYHAIFHYKG